MNKKLFLIGMFLLFVVFMISLSSAYVLSDYKYTQYSTGSGFSAIDFSKEQCEAGQDFIIQIEPFGCDPPVVRSDLLEDQNTPVFCKLSATKLNPLIEVEAIDSISFSGQYPREVSGIGFQPAQAALGYEIKTGDTNFFDNIGYAIIVLRQQSNESALTNCEESDFGGEVCWVEGNLTARIRYDIKNAFGIGQANFYLPELNDADWNDKQNQYSFWDGKGYLRAEAISDDSAIIGVYADSSSGLSKSKDKMKITSANLKIGETSSRIYVPGFDPCMANLKLKLNGLESPDTYAVLKVNNDIVEVKKNEKFLDNKCYVKKMSELGLSQSVSIVCQEDDATGFLKSTTFDLRIEPKIKLKIGEDEKEYEVGDYLYDGKDKFVYLGYAGTKGDSELTEHLYVYLIELPEKIPEGKLSDDEIATVSKIVSAYNSEKQGNENIGGFLLGAGKGYISGTTRFYNWFAKGMSISDKLEFSKKETIQGKEVSIIGFGDGMNLKETSENKQAFEEYYAKANEDYDTIVSSFSGEKEYEVSETTFGEEAFYSKIVLASDTGQKQEMIELCDEFREAYPDSEKNLDFCEDSYRTSNSEIASQDVLINGKVKLISFVRIQEPTYPEYGARIYVRSPSGETTPYNLRKEEIVYLNQTSGEYMQLISVDEDSAKVQVYLKPEGTLEQIENLFTPKTETLKLNIAENFRSGYQFTLKEINLKNFARVSVIPNIDYAETEADFKFKIGIEKRAFQMTPEKTAERIEKLDDSIEKWDAISDGLKSTLKVMNAGCIGTGAFLTIKNFVQNSGGKTFARQKVMQGEGGWNEECADLKYSDEKYDSVEECFIKNAPIIDAQVQKYTDILQAQNTNIQELQDKHTSKGNLLKEDQINTDAFMNDYSENVITEVSGLNSVTNSKGEKIDLENMQNALDYSSWKNNNYEIEELRDIEFYVRVLKADPNDRLAQERLYGLMYDVQKNAEDDLKKDAAASAQGINPEDVLVISIGKEKAKEYTYGGLTQKGISTKISGVNENTPVQIVYDNLGGKKYVVVLNEPVQKQYSIKRIEIEKEVKGKTEKEKVLMIYDYSGNLVSDKTIQEEFSKIYFKGYDSSSYENEWTNPEVVYFETEPYKGKPAIVPVEPEKGWYVATKQSGISAYDESGKVSSFWLCNVGENGIAEFDSGIGDDICRQVNVFTSEPYDQFPGLKEGEATRLIKKAGGDGGMIEQASKSYEDGVSKVCLRGDGTRECYSVGSPATDISEIKCTDFMSPKECNILFNVCDPVVCPSSRCDFGGNYHVKDVVQSGVVGSIFLCLPNWKEKIYVPVCLTGIQAGIENWVSIEQSYRDCLDTSLKTGETVGICDEIHSIYLCEFFWKQALPLAKLAVPKIVGAILGQNSHGGGEYLGVASAWQNAQDSVSYMTQYYAANSYNAFKYRSTEEVGTEVCKNFASLTYPEGASILDAMTEPESPTQFTGKFEEIPFTTSTNPPISQYKVYYHIYAGNDRGAYYNIYLSQGEESSFYQDTTFRRQVDSGYIAAGDYASETVDFTAPSGYKQLCIVVNGQEECGFKQVSTSFAVNYVEDKYLEEMISDSDIKTETECVSGKVSLYSVVNTNIQEGVENVIAPEIYQEGITRVCSTDNPGLGTDVQANLEDSRWVEVGYCGDKNIKCWIDTQSVKKAIEFQNIEDELLESFNEKQLEALKAEGKYIDNEEFDSKIEEFETLKNADEKLSFIEEIYDKVFYNRQKAKLILLRGNVYAQLALDAYHKYLEEMKAKQAAEKISEEEARGDILETIEKMDGELYIKISNLDSSEKSAIDKSKTIWTWNNIPIIQDYDGEGSCNCFDSVMHVYKKAGVSFGGFKYCIEDGLVDVDKDGCQKNKDIIKENLQEGDILSVRDKTGNTPDKHNIIFIKWINSETGKAQVLDWRGTPTLKLYSDETWKNKIGAYRIFEMTLKFDEKSEFGTVYAVGKPVYSVESGEGETEIQEIPPSWEDEEVIMGYISPTFKYRDGTKKLYYKFDNDKWYWSFSGDSWIILDNLVDGQAKELDDENKDFIKLLRTTENNYIGGLNFLLNRVLGGVGKGIFNPDLITDNVDFNHEGIFEVSEITGLNEDPVYFKYEKQWFASFGGKSHRDDYWFPVSEMNLDKDKGEVSWNGKKVVGVSLSDEIIDLVNSLDGKDKINGAANIFNAFYTPKKVSEETRKNVNDKIDLTQFTEKQIAIIETAQDCKDCKAGTYGSVCDEKLCEAIGIQIGEYCEYNAGSDLEIASCFSKGKREKELSNEQINSAVSEIDKLLKDYTLQTTLNSNDNLKNFVLGLSNKNILFEEEYKDFSGEGKAFSFETAETLGELRNFLITGKKEYTEKTASEIIEILIGKHGDVKINSKEEIDDFVWKLYQDGVLTREEYNYYAGDDSVSRLIGELQIYFLGKGIEISEDFDSLIDFCNTQLVKSEKDALDEFIELNNLQNLDVCEFISIKDNHVSLVSFRNSGISDISSLSYFTELGRVNLANNGIVSVGALGFLKSIEYINLFQNDLVDISPLEKIDSLVSLEVGNNCLSLDYDYSYFVDKEVVIDYKGNPREDCFEIQTEED